MGNKSFSPENTPDQRITKFIGKHHVLTLCTLAEDRPWCCHCFYAFDGQEVGFVFSSEMETTHIRNALANNRVAGAIALETRIVGKVQGVQFTGTLMEAGATANFSRLKGLYLKRFPYAALMESKLWWLSVDFLKLTDNQLGFGKKILWERLNKSFHVK